MSKEKCEFAEFMAAQEDDRARLEQEQEQPESLAAQIEAYLTDRLSSREMDALYRSYGQGIEKERLRREQEANRKRARDERKARSLWIDDISSQADMDAADAEIKKFILTHPNFRRDIPQNAQILLRWLAENNLLCTLENLEAGYAFLKPQNVFIQQTEEEQAEGRMSASEYKKMHSSDWPEEKSIPPLIVQRIDKVLDTFVASNPRYVRSDSNKDKIVSAFLKSGMQISTQSLQQIFDDLISRGELELSNAAQSGEVLTVTNLGGHAPGFPRQPIRPSFRRLVRELSADELKQRMLDDKGFESALDNLK